VDFDKFAEGTPEVDPKDPIALYKTLDRQQSHHQLRPAQQQLLEAWAARRGERDIVLKLATGSGKTTVGLVALYSHMQETKQPCLFLCPTNQLVGQVLEESERCKIPVVPVFGGRAIPPEAHAGEAIVVTSVQSIFQARAGRFESAGFYAILIDDAHAALEIVRQQFRVHIPREDALYDQLHALFKDALTKQSRGSAEEIAEGHGYGALEVPHWVWAEHLEAVTGLITARSKEEDELYKKRHSSGGVIKASLLEGLPLSWGLIKNVLDGCRCVFSVAALEIAPELPPVERIKTYAGAKRRIFMSATISDESVLVRELGCSEDAAKSPVEVAEGGGVGERMILVPRLMTAKPTDSIKWKELAEICKGVAERNKTVVVLTPTFRAAKKWASIPGAWVVESTDEVPKAVAALRSQQARFVVFANRYDGLDLPDEACRLLVLDGAPVALSVTDMVDMACAGGSATRRRAVTHRIEQGLGRAVRSPSDYSVVILYDNDLVELISKTTTRVDLTAQTRKQIEFGIKIAQDVKRSGDWRNEVVTLLWQCLNREEAWKRAHRNFTKTEGLDVRPENDDARLAQAVAERRAWSLHVANRGADAATTLRSFLNAHKLSPEAEAYLVQRIAWYLWRVDPSAALAAQTHAREIDHQLLMPPAGVKYRKGASNATPSTLRFVAWLHQFDHPNAAISAIEGLRARLTFAPDASHDVFEGALSQLGTILGFESRRPDRESGEGPDVLWMDGQQVIALEAKNRTKPETQAIAKHVAGQLMQAEAWAKTTYPDRGEVVPVSVHPRTKVGAHAILPAKARIITPEVLNGLLDALVVVVGGLQPVGGQYPLDVATRLLNQQRLTLAAIVASRMAEPTK
jgi:hypothetical protein